MKPLQFWAIINDQISGTKSIEHEIKLFEKETNIKVELKEFPWGKIWDYLINSIKEDNKPDVVQVGSSWISILSQIGFLDDITDLVDKELDNLYNISPKIGNKYYALPWILDLNLLFVRKKDFDNGFAPETIDDLLLLCKKSKKNDLFAIGGIEENILIQYISSFLWAYNGDYVINDSFDLLDKKNFKGIKVFFDLIKKYGVKKSLLNIYGDVMWDFFLKGKGVFTFTNAWVINAFIKPYKKKDDFSVQVVPGNEKTRYPFMGGACLGIVKGTEMVKESRRFLRFLTEYSSEKRYLSKIGLLPARKDVMNDRINYFLYKDAILKSLEVGRIYPPVPYWGSFEKIFVGFIHKMFAYILEGIYSDKVLEDELKIVNAKVHSVISLWER
ncbi:MAG: extracellular solute-binding protein [Spirochaetes bacterium]|nr:extracellular solute-binding protein [Spirochaetota bacterium]